MIDPRILRDEPDRVRAAQAKRGLSADVVDRALSADSARREDASRLDGLNDLRDACGGACGIERHVHAVGLQDREQADNGGRGLGLKEADAIPLGASLRSQQPGQPVRRLFELAIRERFSPHDQRRGVGPAQRLAGRVILQQPDHANTPSRAISKAAAV